MKILLLHLSDIHITRSHNPVLEKQQRILEAVQNLEPDVSACFIVVSGDVAFSGREEEYELAFQLLNGLKVSLCRSLKHVQNVHVVVVPGNHDCFIPDEIKHDEFRNDLIDNLVADPSKAQNQRYVETCTALQDSFFTFLSDSFSENLEEVDRLFYRYNFEVDEKRITFLCHNTAWIVRRDIEQQGKLVFPVEQADYSGCEDRALVLSVLHHPYNWYQDMNARELRNKVQAASDFVLTGHEHEDDGSLVSTRRGERIQYFEGGILQDNNDDGKSSFNAILVDLKLEKQKVTQFGWDGELYRPTEESDAEYTDFPFNQQKTRGQFELSVKHLNYLKDSGANLAHRNKSKVTLEDSFIDLELMPIDAYEREGLLELDEETKTLKASELIIEASAHPLTFIAGADKSGKTTLLKTLYNLTLAKIQRG